MDAKLIFEDGTIFHGRIFTQAQDVFGEVVFNTAHSGYQEILTDPSYSGQMVAMTYPLIGNYGINNEDIESRKLYLSALIVREYCDYPSNWRSTKSLKDYLNAHNVIGLQDVDTRRLTRFIRENGALRAMITTSEAPEAELIHAVQQSPAMAGANLAEKVSCPAPYVWSGKLTSPLYKVAVIDCGIKRNILRLFADADCECEVFPTSVTAAAILSGGFDGLFISNGPGDPEVVTSVIECVRECLGKLPIFGICLGHQILGLALGGRTYKLKFGHHGANHPVKNLKTGHVEITSQNHGFCVDIDSLKKADIEITHINLNDQTVEGIRHRRMRAMSVQYHPEAAPGPHDSQYLFKDFIAMMGPSA